MARLFEHPEGTSTGEVEIDRILTAPNAITTARLLCIPLFLYLLFGRDSRGWAALLLGVLGATDWVDGYVARRFNQSSTFGKMFDPTVDRLMMVVTIVAVLVDGQVPRWFAITVLVREIAVSIWVVVVLSRTGKRMNVTWWGKCGTFGNMCAFPWFLFAAETSFGPTTQNVWTGLAYAAAIPGVVFSLASAAQYVGLGRGAFVAQRAARSTG